MNGQPIPKNPNQRIGVQDAQQQWNKNEKAEIALVVDPSKNDAGSPLVKKVSTDKCKYLTLSLKACRIRQKRSGGIIRANLQSDRR